jgi:hypothetical protein
LVVKVLITTVIKGNNPEKESFHWLSKLSWRVTPKQEIKKEKENCTLDVLMSYT